MEGSGRERELGKGVREREGEGEGGGVRERERERERERVSQTHLVVSAQGTLRVFTDEDEELGVVCGHTELLFGPFAQLLVVVVV